MAGGGFLSSMFTTMVAKLHSLASPSTTSSSSSPRRNIEQEMSKLTETMRRIQSKLDDSEEENHAKSHSKKLWLSELKDVAHDAEDVVEEYEYEVLCSKQLHESNNGTHEDELANKAAEIRKRFIEITKEWKLLTLPENAGKRKRSPSLLDMNRETGSLVVESDVLGREKEKDMLVEWLLSEDDAIGNGVSVIAVIGMGGLGKTTLAQLVYNDPRVKSYFNLRGWVCVSENVHVVSLTEKILHSFTKVKVHEELDGLQNALQENLQGKKFLLILDDVWNEAFTLWDELRKPLVSAQVGKVIVTTRNQSVARIMVTRSPLDLNCLPFDVCWSLFKRVTLGGADKNLQPHLEDLGRKIVDKCKGLPLAVKVLGGALRNKEDIESWEGILENEMWESEQINDGVLPALQISYDCMPIQLKRCFQFLCLFPKDTHLDSKEIVQLWMSQGLLPLDGDKTAEDIGRNYIKKLAERSMLNPVEVNLDPFFFMHDLVHDLAQYVAQDECFCVINDKLDTKKLAKIRHLSGNIDLHKVSIEDTHLLKCVQTIKDQQLKLMRSLFIGVRDKSSRQPFITRQDTTFEVLDDLFQKLKYIRALQLRHISITELPDSLGNLKLLRYFSILGTKIRSLPECICSLYNLQTLDLSFSDITELPDSLVNLKLLCYLSIQSTKIRSLPESICSLYNLQTLDLRTIYIHELPRQIGDLISLRHLLLPYGGVFLPSEIGNLTNLQTLNCFDVSCEKEPCNIGELNNLMKIGGYIFIYISASVNRFSNSKPPLKTKKCLDSLDLHWYDTFDRSEKDKKNAEWQLEYLEPHVNLKTLKITRYPGVSFAGWVGASSFTKLTRLHLEYCNNCNKLPPLGQLPSLEELNIWQMDGVRHVGREFCSMLMASPSSSQNKIAFPSLKRLLFSSMENWEAWDGVEIGDFPSLHYIDIFECPKLIKFPQWPSLSSVKEMRLRSCGALDIPNLHSLTNLNSSFLTSLNSLIIKACRNPEFTGLPATLQAEEEEKEEKRIELRLGNDGEDDNSNNGGKK